MKDYKHAVYIGRFQPFHNGHLEVIKKGLEIADEVIVVVGSVNSASTIKNPWSFEERREMIMQSVASLGWANGQAIHIRGVRDYHYNENSWIAEVQAKTDELIDYGDSVVLLGQYKDASSYYLKHFPQWDFVPTDTDALNATDIREAMFDLPLCSPWGFDAVPPQVSRLLTEWRSGPQYQALVDEYAYFKRYKAQWADTPFPPTFVTVDAVVVCSGHVLVVERGFNPGKGLYALPGGFIKQNEKIESAMLRELKEETGIRVAHPILASSIVGSKVFDHPERSLRGRTISHGFYLKLADGRLPEVRGNDDAAAALWMPLIDVAKNERQWFEDHSHIIHYFMNYS